MTGELFRRAGGVSPVAAAGLLDCPAAQHVTVEESGDGALVVRYDASALTTVMLVAAALFLGVAGYDYFIGVRGTERLVGLLASAVTLLLVALLFFESSSFQFSRATRTVIWRRRWAMRRRSGSLAFGDIVSVQAERPMGDDGTPSRRIVLRTKDGGTIPITVGYQPDGDGAVLEIANRLRALLGQSQEQNRTQTVRTLVEAGKTIEAVRVLREEAGLSLTEAKRQVDELRRK
jgi:hypothetical protein